MSISDEEIRKIIMPLMLSGAKMLDRHCPKCGSPLFEKDGKVFCPVCEHRKRQKANEMKGVEERLMEKLTELANSLPDDINELEKHLRVMELIINLLERYKQLEGGE
ncbi:Sjogren's syndrome/scleroderma autoantigen 1 family protein [Thermococcus sp.]|uniref:Sjogren's syndrome/scleroderma autoantigen 1 family protein n=1 Tax=Thermococcus sp. TaxID=35749 RepID=UPI00260694E7|nr:Sjogren's syndrome/scleroderma autoantigen 1 family protein [Thermococcus sp.]